MVNHIEDVASSTNKRRSRRSIESQVLDPDREPNFVAMVSLDAAPNSGNDRMVDVVPTTPTFGLMDPETQTFSRPGQEIQISVSNAESIATKVEWYVM